MPNFDLIRDLHKDARGFRPSSSFMTAFEAQTPAKQQADWDSLLDELSEREAQERYMQLTAQREYETRIEGMVADYSITRATAIRWDIEAFDVDIKGALQYHKTAEQEIEHFLYNQGIAFQFFPMYVAEITSALNL
jgi:hypothetical protein